MNRLMMMLATALIAQPAIAASYSCSAKTISQCLNGKPCKTKAVDDSAYFIVDADKQTFEECQIEDCRIRPAVFWKDGSNALIVSHQGLPRTMRLSLLSGAASKWSGFTQSTLSSVMTVVQSGTCFERLVAPPPTYIPPNFKP